MFSQAAPQYTIRFLLQNAQNANKQNVQLKPFSHFTLGCTMKDEGSIPSAFQKIVEYFKGPVTFKAEEVRNLGSENQPLWAVKLALGDKGKDIQNFLSDLFDSIMCPDRGVTYLWKSENDKTQRCAHITIGPRKEDQEFANTLVECDFTFHQVDYKKVGPHDPHISLSLEKKSNLQFEQ